MGQTDLGPTMNTPAIATQLTNQFVLLGYWMCLRLTEATKKPQTDVQTLGGLAC